MIFETKRSNIIYTLIVLFFGLLWFFIYNRTDEYPMYKYDENRVADTTKVYMVAPRYTKMVYSRKDTVFLFFNKDRKLVKKIEKDSLKYYVIKNNKNGI
jgi:hypothetical protein